MTKPDFIPPMTQPSRSPRLDFQRYRIWGAALLAGLSLLSAVHLSPARADETADPLASLRQFSDGSKALYHKVSSALIRVRMDVSRETLFNGQLRKEFEDWKTQHAEQAPVTTTKYPRKERPIGGPLSSEPANTNPLPQTTPQRRLGQGEIAQLRKFFEQRQANLDPESLARFRLIVARADAAKAGQALDFTGVMVDGDHHALVLFPLIAYPDGKPFEVILPDGSSTTAALNATDYLRGISVVTLSASVSPGNEPKAIPIAPVSPSPGELLLAVGSSREQLFWTLASELTPRKLRPGYPEIHPFSVKGLEDRSTAFLMNTEAQLAGVAFERTAYPYEDMRSTVDHLVKGEATARGSRLGIKWAFVFPNSREREENPTLGFRPAIRITEVTPKSPADLAGVQVDDYLLAINRTPINHLTQILTELANRPQDIELTIVRKNEEQRLTVKLAP